jgi:hypothetical protein
MQGLDKFSFLMGGQEKRDQPLTYDNLSKSLHTLPLGFYHSLLSFKTSGLVWPLRKAQRSPSCILGGMTLTRPIRATSDTCQGL